MNGTFALVLIHRLPTGSCGDGDPDQLLIGGRTFGQQLLGLLVRDGERLVRRQPAGRSDAGRERRRGALHPARVLVVGDWAQEHRRCRHVLTLTGLA